MEIFAIKISEEQKEHFLEMCAKLFPENYIKFTDDYYCEWSLFLESDPYKVIDNLKEVSIHWFEFCMMHLVDKIFEEWDKVNYENIVNQRKDFYIDVNVYNIHPVDSLYEEFLKLK